MLSTFELARWLGGRAVGPDRTFLSVGTDTRAVVSGMLFVALRGERFDGHAFAVDALRLGAVAALVEAGSTTATVDAGGSYVVVPDTRLALMQFARLWRERFTLPMIGVVGSNGKTTVKEMTAAILRAHFGPDQVLATAGNLNNDIGLPLTLLRLTDAHRAAVVEIGMNHPGETALLAVLAKPTIGLVNNAQREHQEFMKSVAEVAREHAALIAALPDDGLVVINADDEHAPVWREAAGARFCREFGRRARADVTARHEMRADGIAVVIRLPEGSASAILHIPGEHNVSNALAAAAAASLAGVPVDAIARGLTTFRPAKGRLQTLRGPRGATVIDDTYNANPDSVRAAIDLLRAAPGRRILVLGDMGEVGDQGASFHAEAGLHARAARLDRLLALGELTLATVHAFGAAGEHFADVEALSKRLCDHLTADTTVLVKGSRFMRM